MAMWLEGEGRLVTLPSGAVVRGRGIRAGPPATAPDLGVYLLARPLATPWQQRWVPWRDFGLPRDGAALASVLAEVLERADAERVELACAGGLGRTGTALACLAVLDGVPAHDAVAWVRRHYHSRAVETPWQRAFVRGFWCLPGVHPR
jgi:protein-tyrosine phosphatase